MDLKFMNEAFMNGYPVNLERPHQIDLSATISKLDSQLPDSVSKMVFENTVRKVLFEVGCIHTSIAGWSKTGKIGKSQLALFPSNVFCDGNKLLFLDRTNDLLQTSVRSGNEIISINQHTAKEITDILKYYHPVDGQSFDFNLNFINKEFPSLYYKCIDRKSSFVVQYKDSEGVLQTETLPGMLKTNKAKRLNQPKVLIQGNDESFSVIADTIGLLSIKSFHKKSNKFYENVFTYLERHFINDFVIDVRENLGGSRANTKQLISYLTQSACKYETIRPRNNLRPYLKGRNKFQFLLSYIYYDLGSLFVRKNTAEGVVFTSKIVPKKHGFIKNIYVLVNGFTGSSATLLASYLKHHANAAIIGQQTGGGECSNNGGSYPSLVLPNSGLTIKTAAYLVRYDVKGNNANGIIPDHIINYDVNTYNTRDLELEKVLQLIQQARL